MVTRLKASFVLLLLLLSACHFPGSSVPAKVDATSTPTTVPPAPTPLPLPEIDLDKNPQLWFAPFPNTVDGSNDYMSYFREREKWPTAVERVDVFKFYAGHLLDRLVGQVNINQMVTFLQQEGIALAVEITPMTPTAACGQNTKGYAGWLDGEQVAQKIKAAGGKIDYLALDGPMWWGSLYPGESENENPCHYTFEQTAQNVKAMVDNFRAYFPEMIVGDIHAWAPGLYEPYELVLWWDAYEKEMGEPFGFFHLDHEYKLSGWEGVTAFLMSEAHTRGIEFGNVYFGEPWNENSQAWLALAEQRYELYENWYQGPSNDDVVFQSWQIYPDYILPETQADTYAYAINRYFREAPELTLDVLDLKAPTPWNLSGKLTSPVGVPLGGKPIYLSVSTGLFTSAHAGVQFDIAPRDNILAETLTDKQGIFHLTLETLPENASQLIVWYPGTPINTGTGADGFRSAYATLNIGAVGRNIAWNVSATASNATPTEGSEYGVDGSLETIWNSGGPAPQWYEIDLGYPQTIIGIQLTAFQLNPGQAEHTVLVKGTGTGGEFVPFHTFNEKSQDYHIFSYFAETALEGIQYIRIETTRSPSWVIWREVEAFAP